MGKSLLDIIPSNALFEFFSSFGLIFLMFLAGLEVSWSLLVKEEKDAFVVTLFTITSSLILGTFVVLALGFSFETALIMGVCFGITAEATKARALLQLKSLKTRVGSLLMGVGVINDIIGVVFLVFLTFIFTREFVVKDIWLLIGMIVAFAVGILVHYRFDRYNRYIKSIEKLLFLFLVPFFFIAMGQLFNLASLFSF